MVHIIEKKPETAEEIVLKVIETLGPFMKHPPIIMSLLTGINASVIDALVEGHTRKIVADELCIQTKAMFDETA